MAKRSMFDELKQGLHEMKAERQGKITLKTTEVEMPKPIKMSKTRIQRIRKANNYSQGVFARILGTNLKTYQNWEQGRSEPNEQAKILLEMVDRNSAFLEELVVVTTGQAHVVVSKQPAKNKNRAKASARKSAVA